MPMLADDRASGHLDYYRAQGISPVRYQAETLAAHLARRELLYRALGLPPVAFRGSRILEVAAGSGQNSLYPAKCQPDSLDLVEPNPTGLADIENAFADLEPPFTAPTIHPVRLEEFDPPHQFHIVLCENWLGHLPHEILLIDKLKDLVAPGGVMVFTYVPPAGFFPNIMRRLLALRIVDPDLPFQQKTERLVEAFGPHLATMPNMTRSHQDWVQDCVLNPHYLDVALPLATVLEAVGDEMAPLATSPRFTTDWRWFKDLTETDQCVGDALVESELRNLHNFVDHRRVYPERPTAANAALGHTAMVLLENAKAWQSAQEAGEASDLEHADKEISRTLATMQDVLNPISQSLSEAVAELAAVWSTPAPSVADVAAMNAFAALFGRETVYLSLTRHRAASTSRGFTNLQA